MKCALCFAVLFSGVMLVSGEPFFSAMMAGTQSGMESLWSRIQKMKEKTASISQAIEQTVPAGPIGNLASSVVSATTNTTANVLKTTTNTIDNVAKGSVNWMKNVTSAYAEKGAEMLLHRFQQYAIKRNMDNMQLPDVETKISGVTVKASGGYFSSFASLYKTKRINVTVSDEGILMNIPLSLATLNTGYEHFQAKLFFMSMSAGLSMQVKTNAINVILRLKAINPCALNVERVEVAALDGLSISYKTDCKTCSSIISSISSGLANYMKGTLKKQIQEGIDNGIQKIITEDSFVCANFVKSTV